MYDLEKRRFSRKITGTITLGFMPWESHGSPLQSVHSVLRSTKLCMTEWIPSLQKSPPQWKKYSLLDGDMFRKTTLIHTVAKNSAEVFLDSNTVWIVFVKATVQGKYFHLRFRHRAAYGRRSRRGLPTWASLRTKRPRLTIPCL